MRATWTILKREVYALFVSPIAYALLVMWVLGTGLNFWVLCSFYAGQPMGGGAQDSPLTWFFGQTTLFYIPMLVVVPLITMRLLAEERSRGTIELLMTAPVTETSVVLGKYFASLVFWVAMWAPSVLYVWLTSRYGDIDLGAVATSYLGIFGIGVYYLAIGTLMSAVAPNQIISAILTFLVLAGLFVVGIAGQFVLGDEHRELLTYLSIWGHMEAFAHGIIDTRYVTFDLSVAALSLSGAVGVLTARRNEG